MARQGEPPAGPQPESGAPQDLTTASLAPEEVCLILSGLHAFRQNRLTDLR